MAIIKKCTTSKLKNINIHVSGKNDVAFDGDYKWECEAITNILKNGIEYSKDNGDIYVNYKATNGRLLTALFMSLINNQSFRTLKEPCRIS